MVVPNIKGTRYTKEIIRVEYEWKPPCCSTCLLFGHSLDNCPKVAPQRVENRMDNGKGQITGLMMKGRVTLKRWLLLLVRIRLRHQVTLKSHQTIKILKGELVLVDDNEKPLDKVDYPDSSDCDDERRRCENEVVVGERIVPRHEEDRRICPSYLAESKKNKGAESSSKPVSLQIHEEFVDAAKPGDRVQVAGIHVILEIQTSLKLEETEVNQRDSRKGVQAYGTVRQRDEDLFREIAMLRQFINMLQRRVIMDLHGLFLTRTTYMRMQHEKLSSSSSLTWSSWTDLSLKMKEVGPDGGKQSKEAKDEDVQRMDQLWVAVCVWRVLPRLGITQDDTTRDYVALFERLACQLVGVPELVLDGTFINGLCIYLCDGTRKASPCHEVVNFC
nr:zinc knuckle CX2CX4HX4C [Tanacetum cinerariifolium]